MNINKTLADRTRRLRTARRAASRLAGHRFWFGLVIIRPKAFQRLSKFSVFFALQRHLWCGVLAGLRGAKGVSKPRSLKFLERHSRHFTAWDCLRFSAFRDRAGLKFYIMTGLDLTTVVSIREEF